VCGFTSCLFKRDFGIAPVFYYLECFGNLINHRAKNSQLPTKIAEIKRNSLKQR
jgi:hypothetical protein